MQLNTPNRFVPDLVRVSPNTVQQLDQCVLALGPLYLIQNITQNQIPPILNISPLFLHCLTYLKPWKLYFTPRPTALVDLWADRTSSSLSSFHWQNTKSLGAPHQTCKYTLFRFPILSREFFQKAHFWGLKKHLQECTFYQN